jgi:hypothetical protein
MKLVWLGAEVGSNKKLLVDMGVTTFGFSYSRAVARGFPKTKKFSFSDYFPENSLIVVHPGITEVKDDHETFAADYQDFVISNMDDIAAAVEFNGPDIDPDFVRQQRPFWLELEERFWPIWRPDLGFRDLVELTEEYAEIAVPNFDALLTPSHQISGHMRSATARLGTSWHGIGIASPESLSQSPLTTAATGSWQSGMRRGETIVWDGTRLVRYPAKMKEQARPRYKAVIEQAGLDYEAIMADDNKEVTRLAIWSYQQLEIDMDKKKPTTRPFRVIEGGGQPDDNSDLSEMLFTGMGGMSGQSGSEVAGVGHRDPDSRNVSRVPEPRTASETAYLPVLGVEAREVVVKDEDGRDVVGYAPFITSSEASFRQCNTCFVAANCPAFKANSACAFKLPVSIQTREQLASLLQALIEMQGSRVAFARFGEELNGGYPDPNVGQEMDRLFKMVESLKKLEENKDIMKITMERSGSAGVLSAIFGDRVANLKEQEAQIPQIESTTVIQQFLGDDK